MAGIQTNRSAITLPSDISTEILQKTQEESAVMKLAKQITLPGRGVTIPVITGDPEAEWVAETGEKPVSNPSLSTKLMSAYKIAVIEPFSKEFLRDSASLYDALVKRLPACLAKTFDATVFGKVNAPGQNFDTFAGCDTHSIIASNNHTTYEGLVEAYTDVTENDGLLNGWVLSPKAKGILMAATDADGRPLFLNNASESAIGSILGSPVELSKGAYVAGDPDVVGIAGDWSQAVYGTVEGIQIDVSDQATLKVGNDLVNLWQRNMIALRAEIEVGFRADTNCFNLLTGESSES